MKRAVEGLNLTPEELSRAHVFVDGNQKIRGLNLPQTPVVSGDRHMKAISAASIVAKVSRDRDIRQWHEAHPQYGFADHKGYGTEEHRRAIAEFGPCQIHRPTFAGVREFVTKP
jgi:ribonuclease HII